MKVVHVTWKDPGFSRNGWMQESEFWEWAKKDVPQSNSVGLLALENDDCVVLVQSVGENQVADAVKIIRSAIQSIKELGEVAITLDTGDES